MKIKPLSDEEVEEIEKNYDGRKPEYSFEKDPMWWWWFWTMVKITAEKISKNRQMN